MPPTTTNTTPQISVNTNPQPHQVYSKTTLPVTTTDITKATKGGKKAKKTRKLYGGTGTTTVTSNYTPVTYKSSSVANSSITSNQNQQIYSQATENTKYDPGAKSTLWNQPATSSTATTGGSRRRKSRKTRKSRKSKKHKRRNTYKK